MERERVNGARLMAAAPSARTSLEDSDHVQAYPV
jgi:hypothetical protein